jgi:PAS domain S-box-containing protein
LKENEERLAQIIHGNSIPTFVIDKSHTITHWNKACERLTGLLSADMIGTKNQWKPFYLHKRPTLADLVLDRSDSSTFKRFYDDKYRDSSLLSEAYEAEDYFDFREVGKWLFFTAAPLKNTSGDIIGAIETLQDITDRKRMEQEIRDYHKILETRIEERTEQLKITYDQLLHAEKLSAAGKLAASIAHEFGNPIIGIRNFLKALLKSSSIEKNDAEVIELAVQECQRVKDLISNLQDFNRPTSGTIAPMNLHKAIDDMLLFCKKDMKERRIKVVKKYAKNLPRIYAISDQIKQVILNCLNNAAESIKEDYGTVTIKTEVNDNKVYLRISDTGKGIKAADLDSIFEPFFSTKAAVEGTGLGLSVSYGIIKRHCGDIEVSKTSDKGTTFTISLPIKVTE